MASRSQLLPILSDVDPPQGVPKPPQSTQKPKKSQTKNSLKNSLSMEPPKMSSDYLWLNLPQSKGVRVLEVRSEENLNFAWKVLHFLVFRKLRFFKPQGGIDNPQLACAAPCSN